MRKEKKSSNIGMSDIKISLKMKKKKLIEFRKKYYEI